MNLQVDLQSTAPETLNTQIDRVGQRKQESDPDPWSPRFLIRVPFSCYSAGTLTWKGQKVVLRYLES